MTDALAPLLSAVNSGSFTTETLKQLRNLCANGPDFQNAIRESLPDSLFIQNISPSSPFLLLLLQIATNLSVQNPTSQLKLFPLIIPLLSRLSWTLPTATAALLFINTCTRPESVLRPRLTIDLLAPFFELAGEDEEFDFLLVSVVPAVATEAVSFALENPRIALRVLDLLHDAVENDYGLCDIERFVPALLGYIGRDELPLKGIKSQVVGVFTALVGFSEEARVKALRLGAVDVLLRTKKVDRNDQSLLEWCVAALRILTGEEE
jgi:hypothetical protein